MRARTLHGTHSAFVYEMYQKVVQGDIEYYDFTPIEHLRSLLKQSDEVLDVVDYGAGGRHFDKLSVTKRKVSDIAKHSAVPASQGRVLFRLANFMRPKIMLEIGTSLGISSLYQAKACPNANFITLEGSPETAKLASKNFQLLKANNIKQVVGNFDETLPQVLKTINSLDYVFFDGNHKKEPTLNYFRQCLPLAGENSVFIFDDIRWSTGMYEAWQEIIKEPTAAVSIDMFSFGILIFRKGQVKEHFTLKL